ncbi:MAG: DUF2924 domain-containing protein [Magnetococcales bacterium]|nr:DUF2924 domain-containing protein [Magnetococcales bacterium]
MTTTETVLKRVANLPGTPIAELRTMWKNLYNQDPPPHGKPFLVRRLAYRIQELEWGGLSEITESRMNALARGDADPKAKSTANGKKRKKNNHPTPGTNLMREWNGVEYVVTVQSDGFEFKGRKFKSLSAIAKEITGTQWSGPLFFGIRKNGASK